MPSLRLAAMVVLTTSNGCPRVVTSNKLRPAPSNKLENLTGFFSKLAGGSATGRVARAAEADMTRRMLRLRGP